MRRISSCIHRSSYWERDESRLQDWYPEGRDDDADDDDEVLVVMFKVSLSGSGWWSFDKGRRVFLWC